MPEKARFQSDFSGRGRAVQEIKGQTRRPLASCMALAASSLPVPDSPAGKHWPELAQPGLSGHIPGACIRYSQQSRAGAYPCEPDCGNPVWPSSAAGASMVAIICKEDAIHFFPDWVHRQRSLSAERAPTVSPSRSLIGTQMKETASRSRFLERVRLKSGSLAHPKCMALPLSITFPVTPSPGKYSPLRISAALRPYAARIRILSRCRVNQGNGASHHAQAKVAIKASARLRISSTPLAFSSISASSWSREI